MSSQTITVTVSTEVTREDGAHAVYSGTATDLSVGGAYMQAQKYLEQSLTKGGYVQVYACPVSSDLEGDLLWELTTTSETYLHISSHDACYKLLVDGFWVIIQPDISGLEDSMMYCPRTDSLKFIRVLGRVCHLARQWPDLTYRDELTLGTTPSELIRLDKDVVQAITSRRVEKYIEKYLDCRRSREEASR